MNRLEVSSLRIFTQALPLMTLWFGSNPLFGLKSDHRMPSPETCRGLGMSQTRHLVSGEGLVNAILFFPTISKKE